MNIKFLSEFIVKKWSDMPQSVRVGTYLVFLISYIYLLFAPQYIDGQLKAVSSQTGSPFPLRNHVFEMFVDGRSIRFVTDGRGRYAIPKPSKLPLSSVELWFFPEGMDEGSPDKKVLIPILSAMNGRADILKREGEYVIYNGEISERFTSAALSLFIGVAHAQAESDMAPTTGNPTEVTANVGESTSAGPVQISESAAVIAGEIADLVKRRFGMDAVDNSRDLVENQGISNQQLSMLLHELEGRYGVVINSNRQKVGSIEQIADAVARQRERGQWESLSGTQTVKPKGLLWRPQPLVVQDTGLKIETVAVANDSVQVKITSDEGGEEKLLFADQILSGERVVVQDSKGEYAIELEKVDKAGFDRLINAKAAYLNVKAKSPQ